MLTSYLDSALFSYNMALSLGEKLDYTAKTQYLYEKLAEIYKEKKDFVKSLKYLEKSQDIKENLLIKNNQNFNLVKNDLYNSTIEYKNYIREFLLFIITIIFLIFQFFYKKTKKNNVTQIYRLNHSIDSDNKSLAYVTKLAYNKDNSFFSPFLQLFPSFGDNLIEINNRIKSSDIEYCAFLKLNIETKQIAIIKNISVRAVEGKKYRIRKKLNISSNENIYLWIAKI